MQKTNTYKKKLNWKRGFFYASIEPHVRIDTTEGCAPIYIHRIKTPQ